MAGGLVDNIAAFMSSHLRLASVSLALLALRPAAAGEKIFPPDAVVDVTKAPYEAWPDDGRDDTAAIQRAVSENVNTGRVLYFPAGVYDVSDTLVAKNTEGIWRAHLTLQGQNRETTILRLADHAPGFDRTKAMLVTASHWQEGDAADGGGNKAFRNNIFDLTFDTGRGNAGAVAVDYAVSNQGAIENVTIRSGDGGGRAGISMRRRIPGPGLIKNVSITGFDCGLDLAGGQYGMTLENVTVSGQKVAGIRTDKNLLHIHRLKSDNSVPALLVTDRLGCATLIDAELKGGGGIACAGTFFGRNINDAPALLAIKDTPEFWNADPADWAAVGPRAAGEPDDTAAIQRAIDSGKGTVYFPNNRTYFLSDTVVVRGAVKQILGLGSEISLGAAKAPFSDAAHPRPLFRLDPTAGTEVFLENLFFNAQYPGEILFENNTPATVVIKHCAGWVGAEGCRLSYRNTDQATGEVFVEDVFLPGWEFRRQKVWARQFNPENYDGDGSSPQVANLGGELWILGFKTEGPAPFLVTKDGTTELLGGYNYISAAQADPVPAQAIPYVAERARISLTFATDNFRETDYPTYIRAGRDFGAADLPPRNGHQGDRSVAVPLFRP